MTGDVLDWGDGDYSLTAAALMPAAEVLVEAAGVTDGEQVLDVACGTGNASVAAAARGAQVVGVDAAAALLDQAEERVPGGRFVIGEAEDLPVADGEFDVALSVFGVIFSPAPDGAASELLRAVKPGGRVAITTWAPEGAIFTAGGMLAQRIFPPRQDPPRWGEAAWVRSLFERAGATGVEVRDERLSFTAASAAGWFAEQEEHHPVWRFGRRRLDDDAWQELRERSVEVLEQANEDPTGFRTTSRYLVLTCRR